MSETTYLAVALATGGYAILTIADILTSSLPSLALSLPSSLSSVASPLLAAPSLVVCLVTRRLHHNARQARLRGCLAAPVFPHRDPVLGSDWITRSLRSMRANLILEQWDDDFRSVGPSFWFQSFGSWTLMTQEPENVKAVLGTDFDSWHILGPRQTTISVAIGPHAIFSVNGDEWKRARSLIRPSFVRNQIADLKCIDRHVENLLARIPRDGETVDMQELFYLWTMDLSTDFMFGYSSNTLREPSPEAQAFATSFDYALLKSGGRARLGWVAFLMPDAKFRAATATIRDFVDDYVARVVEDEKLRTEAHERQYVFLNELLASGVGPAAVRDQLLAIILGGRDTTASTLSALFWVLARRRDVVDELRAEVALLEGRRPGWEEMKNMQYLNAVVKEVLRLYAPVATNSRGTVRDTVLPRGGGPDGQSPLFMPKGTFMRWSLYSMHRRKDIFGEDAEEFRPGRWADLRAGWEWVPFSGGPRICPGQQFALTQMCYVIVRIFQTFKAIEGRDDRPMLQALGTTTSLPNGCHVGYTLA